MAALLRLAEDAGRPFAGFEMDTINEQMRNGPPRDPMRRVALRLRGDLLPAGPPGGLVAPPELSPSWLRGPEDGGLTLGVGLWCVFRPCNLRNSHNIALSVYK